MSEVLIEMRQVHKSFAVGSSDLKVIKGLDFSLKAGERVGIIGASGSGKSTFLHLLGGLETPTQGEVWAEGRAWSSFTEEQKAHYRNKNLGFIFQLHHLMQEFSAIENVMLPARIGGASKSQAEEMASHMLGLVGLQERARHFPSQLSGGELQRVSIARALVQNPKILIADEPTGSLDSQTSLVVQELLFELQEKLKMALVVVTHDLEFARKFARCLRISDGQWVGNSF